LPYLSLTSPTCPYLTGAPEPGAPGHGHAEDKKGPAQHSSTAARDGDGRDGTETTPVTSLRVEAAEEGRACVQSEQQHEAARQKLCGCSVLTYVLSVLLTTAYLAPRPKSKTATKSGMVFEIQEGFETRCRAWPGRPPYTIIPQQVLAVLAEVLAEVLAASASGPLLPLGEHQRGCLAGSFLAHVLAPHKHLLLVQANGHVLCREAFDRLHRRHNGTVEIFYNESHAYDHEEAEVVVLLLASAAVGDLERLLRTTARVRRSIPVLAVLAVADPEAAAADADLVARSLTLDRWWAVTVALQAPDAEGAGASLHVYTSALSPRAGARCTRSWSPPALASVWRPDAPRLLPSLLAPTVPADLRGCVMYLAYVFSPPYVFRPDDDDSVPSAGTDFILAELLARASNATLVILHDPDYIRARIDYAERIQESTAKCTAADSRLSSENALAPRSLSHSWGPAWPLPSPAYGTASTLGNGSADMVVGGLYPHVRLMQRFSYSEYYSYNTIRCFTLRTRALPSWQYPFRVMTIETWCALLTTAVVLVGAMHQANGKGLTANAMTVVGVLWEGNPAPRSARGRIALYVFLWSLFCLHISPAYRAALATANVRSLTEPGVRDLKDVKRVFMQASDMQERLKNYPHLNRLASQVDICRNPFNCSDYLLLDPYSSALIMTSSTYRFYSGTLFMDVNGRPLLREHPLSLASFKISVLMEDDSPLSTAINRLTRAVVQAGLVRKWLKDYQYVYERRVSTFSGGARGRQRLQTALPKPLNASHILAPLTLLAAGLVGSLVAFLYELAEAPEDREEHERDTSRRAFRLPPDRDQDSLPVPRKDRDERDRDNFRIPLTSPPVKPEDLEEQSRGSSSTPLRSPPVPPEDREEYDHDNSWRPARSPPVPPEDRQEHDRDNSWWPPRSPPVPPEDRQEHDRDNSWWPPRSPPVPPEDRQEHDRDNSWWPPRSQPVPPENREEHDHDNSWRPPRSPPGPLEDREEHDQDSSWRPPSRSPPVPLGDR
ncbi:BUD13-like protein, partial [Frankliniella fusca]